MADTRFTLEIALDGKQAAKDAKKLRSIVEKELMRLDLHGEVEITGLERANELMGELRDNAGALGRAIGSGLGRQWDRLEDKLTTLQSQITGLVREGEKTSIAADMLDDMPELEQALSENDKKALDLSLRMRELQSRVDELSSTFSELGSVKVQPMSGGQLRTMSELFKGLSERYTKRKVRKLTKAIDEELAPLEKQVEKAEAEARKAAEARLGAVHEKIEAVERAMDELQAQKPPMSALMGAVTEEQKAWKAQMDALTQEYLQLNNELSNVRSDAVTGDVQELKSELHWRRRELEKPLEEDLSFWREWSMGSVEEIAAALRASGQSAAAGALEQMQAVYEERKRLTTQIKRAFGGLAKGGEAELPQGAQGTMVDFIAAERTLGSVGEATTDILNKQRREINKLIKSMDEARMTTEGLTDAERQAIQKLEAAAKREIRKASRASVPMDEAAEAQRDILGRLAQESRSISEAMAKALAEPEIEEAAEEPAKGVVRIWEWVRDKLVGHSVIPEMVAEINAELGKVGTGESPFADIVDQAKNASTVVNKLLAIQVAEKKSDIKERERITKQTARAQELAAELGADWGVVKEEARESGESIDQVVGRLKNAKEEQKRLNREAERLVALESQARQMAAELGIPWDTVIQKELQAGRTLDDIIGSLRKVDREQREVNQEAGELEDKYADAKTGVERFLRALNDARAQTWGLGQVVNDIDDVGRGLMRRGTAITGGLTVAGRDYVNLASEADVASRALNLNRSLTKQMREEVIGLSADLAVLDPQATAQGVSVWAAATGQLVDSQSDLRQMMAQTIPVQQLAALGQANIETVTDASVAAINQFEMSLDDTTQVVSVFNKVSDDTLASIGDVAEAFKYVGPNASDMGESIEDVGAQLAILADNAIRGSQAGTSLGMMYKNLASPTGKAADELERLFGTQQPFFDDQGNWIGMAQAIDMFAAATENMTDEQRRVALGNIFEENAIRAAIPLIREQTKARQEGINVLNEGAKALDETALDVWQKKVEDWEESDVYRIQQAEMRWKAFWLEIGSQAVDLALPALERGIAIMERVTEIAAANPWVAKLAAAAGAGALTVGGIFAALTMVAKMVNTLQAAATAWQVAFRGRKTAEQIAATKFQGTVVTAAEQFAAIVQASAEGAAATEEAGAVAETGIETAGETEGAAIEIAGEEAGAAVEVAGETSGAGASGIGGAAAAGGAGAAGVGGAAAAGAGGLTIGAVLALIAGGLAVGGAGYEGLRRSKFGQEKELPSLGMAASVAGYGVGKLFGGEDTGRAWYETIASALAPKALEEAIGESSRSVDAWALRAQQQAAAAQDATQATKESAASLYEYTRAAQSTAQLTDEETSAVETYIEYLERQAEATDDFNDQLAEVARDLEADLRDLEEQHREQRKQMQQEEEAFQVQQAEAAAEYRDRQAKAAAEHAKRMQRMEEEHESRLEDIIASRDADALIEERDRYSRERGQAEEDFQAQQAEESARFAKEQAQRQQQFTQRMSDMQAQYEEERVKRLEAYDEQVLELEQQHQEDMARLDQEYFEKINQELGYYELSKEQQASYYQQMLADSKGWLDANRSLWLEYVKSLPTPRTGVGGVSYGQGTYRSRQAGGYITSSGPFAMHAGEFVLNPQSTQMAERALGPLTQDRALAAMTARSAPSISVTVPMQNHFENVGSGDRAWIQAELQTVKSAAINEAMTRVRDALGNKVW